MSVAIRTPIIVAEGQDVAIFSSVEEAEQHLSRHPAPAGERLVFDAQARILEVEGAASPPLAAGPPPAGALPLRLSVARPEKVRAEDLARVLHEYLQACGERLRPGASLDDLIRRCRSIQLYRE